MEGKKIPARYRMDEAGHMRRTWNGRLPEEFNERDMLLFAADTDLALYGRVTDTTLNAARKAGYGYENGVFMPLNPVRSERAAREQPKKLPIKGQLAAPPVPGEKKSVKNKDREVR